MKKELWEKCQALVDGGLGHIVKHLYAEELESNLTKDQLKKLGDISALLDQVISSKSKMKEIIQTLIDMSKKGVISGTDQI